MRQQKIASILLIVLVLPNTIRQYQLLVAVVEQVQIFQN